MGNLKTLVIDEGHVISFRGEEIWIGCKQDRVFSLLSARCHFISLVMLHHRTFPPFLDRYISPPTNCLNLLLPWSSLLHFFLTEFLSFAYKTFLADPVYHYIRPRLNSHVAHLSLFKCYKVCIFITVIIKDVNTNCLSDLHLGGGECGRRLSSPVTYLDSSAPGSKTTKGVPDSNNKLQNVKIVY